MSQCTPVAWRSRCPLQFLAFLHQALPMWACNFRDLGGPHKIRYPCSPTITTATIYEYFRCGRLSAFWAPMCDHLVSSYSNFMIKELVWVQFADEETEAGKVSEKTMCTELANGREKCNSVWLQGPCLPQEVGICSLDTPSHKMQAFVHHQQEGAPGDSALTVTAPLLTVTGTWSAEARTTNE